MLKDGMKIEATHVKKKQLHQYLPAELVQRKKRVSLIIFFKKLAFFTLHCSLYRPLQSIAEVNRSSNGGSSKRISLDSSHLDSSRDTDSGTPFNSPASKPSKPTSDTDDGYKNKDSECIFHISLKPFLVSFLQHNLPLKLH